MGDRKIYQAASAQLILLSGLSKEVNVMFHKAVDMRFLENTAFEVTFDDGRVVMYDISCLFNKYPQMNALKDRDFFLSGKLMGSYGIIWNDDLDIDMETVYEDGISVRKELPANRTLAQAVSAARARTGMTQKQVASLAGIDQSDFSKIERGVANPSLSTLERIASALGGTLSIDIDNIAIHQKRG